MLALDEVLHRLEKAGLRLQEKKCLFLVPEVVYRGYKIDAEGLHPVADEVDAIQAAPAPKNVAELKSFLGLLSHYGKFLPNLSTILAPLYQLLRLSTKWKWGKAEQQAFQVLKELLVSSRVLVHYDPQQKLTLACDGSRYGVGAVLSHPLQMDRRGRLGLHPISVISLHSSDCQKC